MSPVSRYGRWYSRYGRWYGRGAYADRVRTIIAVALVLLYLLAKFVVPSLGGLFVGMHVPFLVLAVLLFLAWPVGSMHDKRIATMIVGVFLLLLALGIL
jgi:hypothetical protein